MSLHAAVALAAVQVRAILGSPVAILAYGGAAVGSALVVAGAFVRTMIPLRWLAVGSNVGFLVFGALHPSYTTLAMAGLLLPVNVYRAAEMMRLTRQVTAAQSSGDLSGYWLKPYMRTGRYGRGHVLFRKGDRADSLYLLADGQIELAEIGREIVPGWMFGEIGLFSPDGRRTHTARCAQDCTVLSIDQGTVRQLYYQNPDFGFHLIGLVAARLSDDVDRLTGQLARATEPHPQAG
jgi:CRP/FNR family transcriptional regulator, cyclic AMP receptor protein